MFCTLGVGCHLGCRVYVGWNRLRSGHPLKCGGCGSLTAEHVYCTLKDNYATFNMWLVIVKYLVSYTVFKCNFMISVDLFGGEQYWKVLLCDVVESDP